MGCLHKIEGVVDKERVFGGRAESKEGGGYLELCVG